MILKNNGWFVSLEAEKNHQSWETVLVTKSCLRQKNQKTPSKMKILDKIKTWQPRFLESAKRHLFRLPKITVFEGVFGFFYKGTPFFDCIKADDLDKIEQSNGIKPQKINFFMNFCKSLPHKGNFCWKVTSTVIYTSYLKHQIYPFCAPSSTLYLKLSPKPILLNFLTLAAALQSKIGIFPY